MSRWIDLSWWTHWAISHSTQCSTTGVTKAMLCAILSEMVYIEDHLLLIGKSSPCSGGSRFLLFLSEWSFTIYPMPYNHNENELSVLLNKKNISFILLIVRVNLILLNQHANWTIGCVKYCALFIILCYLLEAACTSDPDSTKATDPESCDTTCSTSAYPTNHHDSNQLHAGWPTPACTYTAIEIC